MSGRRDRFSTIIALGENWRPFLGCKLLFCDLGFSHRRRSFIKKRSHPAIPNVKERAEVDLQIRVMRVVMRDGIEACVEPTARRPGGPFHSRYVLTY